MADPRPDSDAVWLPISAVKPWLRNPTRHTPASIAEMAESIKALGWSSVPTVRRSDFRLVAGHRRLAAAKLLGLTEIPVRMRDLDDRQSTELALRDQKMGSRDWDVDALLAIVNDGFDLATMGWGEVELAELTAPIRADEPAGVGDKKTAGYSKGGASEARRAKTTIVLNVFVGDTSTTEGIEAALDRAMTRKAVQTRGQALAAICREWLGSQM